jgi:hypothetical protein
MNMNGLEEPSRAHLWVRNNVLGLVAIFLALGGTALAAQVASDGDGLRAKAAAKKKKAKRGPPGPPGPQGPQGPAGSTSGPAGGALAGTYPDPSLDVSGGPCPNGQELVDVSALAALTCSAGVYSDGLNNVAAGPSAFPPAIAGNDNSALGQNALVNNATGSNNTAVGQEALFSNTGAANNNTAIGEDAMRLNSSGGSNTAVGGAALDVNTTGLFNTAVGESALGATTGSDNTALGEDAGVALTTGSNNIAIDNPGVAGESNRIRIGTEAAHDFTFIAGIRGVTTGVADAVSVVIDSNGQLGTASSSRRVKREIEPLGKLRPLMKLRPVSFRYRTGPPELHYGLIAEQVARLMPTLAVFGKDGQPETVQYQELPVLLLAQIQSQQRQITRQQAQIDRLIEEVGGG